MPGGALGRVEVAWGAEGASRGLGGMHRRGDTQDGETPGWEGIPEVVKPFTRRGPVCLLFLQGAGPPQGFQHSWGRHGLHLGLPRLGFRVTAPLHPTLHASPGPAAPPPTWISECQCRETLDIYSQKATKWHWVGRDPPAETFIPLSPGDLLSAPHNSSVSESLNL